MAFLYAEAVFLTGVYLRKRLGLLAVVYLKG